VTSSDTNSDYASTNILTYSAAHFEGRQYMVTLLFYMTHMDIVSNVVVYGLNIPDNYYVISTSSSYRRYIM